MVNTAGTVTSRLVRLAVLTATLCLLAACTDADVPAHNLLGNPSFEHSLDQWALDHTTVSDEPLVLDSAKGSTFLEVLNLDLSFLQSPIATRYRPEIIQGKYVKSLIWFDFLNNEGRMVSRLTYVLNGERDWSAWSDMVAAGVNYITEPWSGLDPGAWHDLVFPDILAAHNRGARRIKGRELSAGDVARVRVGLVGWHAGGLGHAFRVVHQGWTRYADPDSTAGVLSASSPLCRFPPLHGQGVLELRVSRVTPMAGVSQRVAVVPGETYRLVVHAKADSALHVPAAVVRDAATGHVLLTAEAPGALSQAGWTRVEGAFEPMGDAVVVTLEAAYRDIDSDEAAIKQWSVLFDGVRLSRGEPGPVAPPAIVPVDVQAFRRGRFTMRDMSARTLALEAPGTPSWTPSLAPGARWTPVPGPNQDRAVELRSPQGVSSYRAEALVPVPSREPGHTITATAWVRAARPLSAWLEITAPDGSTARSALHPGNGQWVPLTVVLPMAQPPERVQLALMADKATAAMASPTLLALGDDRFQGLSGKGFRFRERLGFRKTERVRIAVVGNSTVYGTSIPATCTLPYLLQCKLEALHPGRFEVVNYGVDAWCLRQQIVSGAQAFNFVRPRDMHLQLFNDKIPMLLEDDLGAHAADQANALSLRDLEPDVILMGSMWNEIYFPCNPPLEVAWQDGGLLGLDYYTALYDYMDAPSEAAYRRAQQAFAAAREAGQRIVDRNTEDGFATCLTPGNRPAEQAAMLRYDLLLRRFVAETSPFSDVWLFTLPSVITRGLARETRDAPDALLGVWKADLREPKAVNWYSLCARVQDSVSGQVAADHGLPLADLDAVFHSEFDPLPVPDRLAVWHDYFTDIIHFHPQGNAYLADRLYSQLRDRFEALAQGAPR